MLVWSLIRSSCRNSYCQHTDAHFFLRFHRWRSHVEWSATRRQDTLLGTPFYMVPEMIVSTFLLSGSSTWPRQHGWGPRGKVMPWMFSTLTLREKNIIYTSSTYVLSFFGSVPSVVFSDINFSLAPMCESHRTDCNPWAHDCLELTENRKNGNLRQCLLDANRVLWIAFADTNLRSDKCCWNK